MVTPTPASSSSSSSSSIPSNPSPCPPAIPPTPPAPNARLVSLLVYNGWPFADHWEYFVPDPSSSGGGNDDVGTVIQARGDVRRGFALEIRRGWDLSAEGCRPDRRVALARVREELFLTAADGGDEEEEEKDGGGGRGGASEERPGCEFERCLFKVPAPGKTLRAVGDKDVEREGKVAGRTRIKQRNCQTWVIESAEQLVREGIFEQEVVDYLRAMTQC